MKAKATRKPSETQLLRGRVKELEDRIEGYLAHARKLEDKGRISDAYLKTVEGRFRAALYDGRHMDVTIRSLARQISDLEVYKAHRERMDARDGGGVTSATDTEARNGAAA